MMNFNRPPILAAALGLTAFALSGSVLAEDVFTWDFSSQSNPPCTANCSGQTHTKTFVSASPSATAPIISVEASAWANTGPGGSNNRIYAADLDIYQPNSGLGVRHMDPEGGSTPETSRSPQHAMDNDRRYELIMFDFSGESIALTEVALGWYFNDSDITILRYEGDLTDPSSVFNSTPYGPGLESLTESNGTTAFGDWVSEGNYDLDGMVDPTGASGGYVSTTFNADKDESSYWIVAAYNNAFGDCTVGTCENGNRSGYDYGNHDYGKLRLVKGYLGGTPPSSVPAPPTFMLMALGLAWLGRKQLKSA